MNSSSHRAGFIHIIGKPNVGKSTLFNLLVQYPLSIVSPKPQTTRQNILGIQQSPNHQAIYIDTPGYLKPAYQLQKIMMRHVRRALVESDLLLWMVDIRDKAIDPLLLEISQKQSNKLLLLLNKTDLVQAQEIPSTVARWEAQNIRATIVPIAAKDATQVAQLAQKIIAYLPNHPPYYSKETLTDKSERFFTADIIRKALFLHYKDEIPYSTDVSIETFQRKENVLLINATIYVERLSQKRIIIGTKGQALKQVGIRARQDLEQFFQQKVFLTQYVKVLPNWRNRQSILTQWGYQ